MTSPLDRAARHVADVVELALQGAPSEPVYSVGIVYQPEAEPAALVTPGVYAGLERTRAAFASNARTEDRLVRLWDPHDFDVELDPPGDLDRQRRESALGWEIASLVGVDDPQRRVFHAAAWMLNERHLPPSLQRTEDFVVFAADFELNRTWADLRASVPPARLAVLIDRGRVPHW
jgi:hypothetical protein